MTKSLVMEAVMWESKLSNNLVVYIYLLVSVHCKESLVWFLASCIIYLFVFFLCNINAGPSLELLFVILCCGNTAALGYQDRSINLLHQITDGVDTGVGQPITLVLSLNSCSIGQPRALPYSHQQSEPSCIALVRHDSLSRKTKGLAISFAFMSSGTAFPYLRFHDLLYPYRISANRISANELSRWGAGYAFPVADAEGK